MTDRWGNWAGNQSAAGIQTVHPRGVEEVARVVADAREAGQRVKVIGAGHSFTGIGRPEDVAVALDRVTGVLSLDPESGLVTVAAGTPLGQLNRQLAAAGLALTNLGDIDAQTLAGAIATGTHGTGARFGGLATQVRALQLVLADGSIARCSAEGWPELFAAARVGLGALGIVTAVTLQTEPAFPLRAEEGPRPLADLLAGFDEWVDSADHAEFYWFPRTRWALTKRNTRLPPGTPLEPQPRWREWLDDDFLSNTVFGAAVGLGRRWPSVVPAINQLSARALTARTFTDASHRVFTSPRRVRFVEMEYAVPRAAIVAVLRELRATIAGAAWPIQFPIEVRVSAGDDIPLSTAYGRPTAYLAVHQPPGADHEPYFRAVERIATEAGGRPHWGKLHYLDAEALAPRYPRFGDFTMLRKRLDPTGLFTNAYLDRVLGPL